MALEAEIEGNWTAHKSQRTQNAGEECQNCQPTPLLNYWRHWPYKRALFSLLRRRRWECTTADFLSHKLRRPAKHVHPTPECWPFLRCGKHPDNEWRTVDDNQKFPWLLSERQIQLSALPRVSLGEVQCSTTIDCRLVLSLIDSLFNLRWPNTVLARALVDAIYHVHKDFKKQTCRQQSDHFIYSKPALYVLFFSTIACSVLMALVFYYNDML